jgi:lysophospholipase L1-like esterase
MASLRLCFIGDSFVNGTGDPECLGWVGRVCKAAQYQGHDITSYNLGVRRETSTDIAARWHVETSLRLPKDCNPAAVFSFGTNDTTLENGVARVDPQTSVNNTRQILTIAHQHYPVLMISPPPIADTDQNVRTARLSQAFISICQTLDIPYLDVFIPLQASTTWMTEVALHDGAHPSATGYQLLAEQVQQWQAWQDLFLC